MFGAFARAIDPDKRRSSAVIAHSPNTGQRGENDEALAALINYSDQFLEIEKAKLELQRQQLELEKEKAVMDQVKLEKTLAFQQLQLELEKEKVAHQFMLEKERLAFEREKFEFECKKWEETKVVPASSTYSVANTAPVSRMIAPSTENSTAHAVIPPPVNQSPKISQQAKNAKKVFISYCWSNSRSKTLKDIEAGVASTEDLDKTGFWDPRKETYEIIQQCGYEPWLDEFELRVGEDLFSQLARALKNEAALVIIHVSDEYAHSDNCRDEFLYANKLKLPIIPLIVGVPGASKSMEPWDVTSLGFQLSKYLYIDARDYHFIESKKEALIAAIKGKMEALAAASNDDVIPIAALPPVIASTHKPKKVFVSYSWANSRNQKMSDFQAGRATKTDVFDAGFWDPREHTRQVIQRCGYEPWLDVDQLNIEIDSNQSLADVLTDEVDVVIVHVSDEYAASVNCRREFEFATSLDIPIIPIIVGEADLIDNTPTRKKKLKPWNKSWLGLMINHSLYIDVRNANDLESNVSKVAEVLETTMKSRIPPEPKTVVEALKLCNETALLEMLRSKSFEELNSAFSESESILDMAISFASLETIKLIIERGASLVDGKSNPILAAVKRGSLDIFKFFLDKGCDVNAVEKTSLSSPLHIAASNGNVEICEALLNHSAKIEQVNRYGLTSFLVAINSSEIEIVKLLLQRGADSYVTDPQSMGNAINAVAQSNMGESRELEIFKILLDAGVPVDVIDNYGCDPLENAVSRNKTSMVRMFSALENKHDLFTVKNLALVAATDGCLETLKFLTSIDCPVKYDLYEENSSGFNVLAAAILGGHLDVVKYLIELDPALLDTKANYRYSMLMVAAQNNQYDIANYLLFESGHTFDLKEVDPENGYSLLASIISAMGLSVDLVKKMINLEPKLLSIKTAKGSTILRVALTDGADSEIVEYLLSDECASYLKLSDRSREGETALTAAIEQRAPETVWKELIDREPSLLEANPINHKTLLHVSAEFNNFGVFKFLMNYPTYKCNLRDMDSEGYTALAYAVKSNSSELVDLICDEDESLLSDRVCDSDMVFLAAQSSCWETIPSMLNRKSALEIDFSIANDSGTTALLLAIEAGNIDLLKFIHGKDYSLLDVIDSNGESALIKACSNRQLEILNYLLGLPDKLAFGFDYKDAKGWTALTHAVWSTSLETVKLLTEANKNIGSSRVLVDGNKDLLRLAIESGSDIELVKYVVEAGKIELNRVSDDDYTAFAYACLLGKLEVVQYLLSLDASQVQFKRKDGSTVLHLAATNDDVELLKLLVSTQQFVLTDVDDSNKTPLAYAIGIGALSCVEYLLSVEPIANQGLTSNDQTSAHLAATNDNLDILKLVLKSASVDLAQQDIEGYTALGTAINYDRKRQAHFLLSQDPRQFSLLDPSNDATNLVQLAVLNGDFAIFRKLMEVRKFDLHQVNTSGLSPLAQAVSGKSFRIAAYLIGQDPSVLDFKDVSTNQNLAQIIVSYGDDTSILKLCCSSRKMDLANIDTEGYTALAKAVENGFYNSVKYLTSLDASQLSFEKKRTKSTLIHLAVQNNDNLLLLQFLLSSGSFDLSAIDSDGKTALAIAYQFGRTECAKYLVNRNPETASFISLKNENLAHFAAANNNSVLLDLCIENGGIDLTLRNEGGLTPLALAVSNGNYEVVARLVAINESLLLCENESNNRSLLHLSILNDDNCRLLQFLLNRGELNFDLTQVDSDGHTVLSYAISNNRFQSAKVLINTNPSLLGYVNPQNQNMAQLAVSVGCKMLNLVLAAYEFDLNHTDVSGLTTLAVAVTNGDTASVRTLVTKDPSQLRYVGVDGSTLLHLAVKNDNNFEILKVLLSKSDMLDLSQVNLDGHTALSAALSASSTRCAKYFAAFLTSTDKSQFNYIDVSRNKSLLHFAMDGPDDEELLTVLLENGTFDLTLVDADGFTPFSRALLSGSIRCVNYLYALDPTVLSFIPNPASGLKSLVQLAVQNYDSLEMLEVLFKSPSIMSDLAHLDSSKNTFFMTCIENERHACFKFGVNRIFDSNYEILRVSNSLNQSLLHLAAKSLKLLKMVTSYCSFDVHQRDTNGMTPLALAIKAGEYQAAEFIYTLDPSTLKFELVSPLSTLLHIAADNTQEVKVFKFLIEYGKFDLHQIGGQNQLPPFVVALQQNNLSVAKYLLSIDSTIIDFKGTNGYHSNISALTAYLNESNGGDVNVLRFLLSDSYRSKFDLRETTIYGDSPLALAVSLGYSDCAKYLLSVDPTLLTTSQCCDGLTVLETAAFYNSEEILDYILTCWNQSELVTDDDSYLSLLAYATFGGEGVRSKVLALNEKYQVAVGAVVVEESIVDPQMFAVLSVIQSETVVKTLPRAELALKRGYIAGARDKNLDQIKLLDKIGVKFDAHLESSGASALSFAVVDCIEAVEYLWNLDNTNLIASTVTNKSLFKAACGKDGVLAAATLFLEKGTDPNMAVNSLAAYPQYEGFTALHEACSLKRVDSIRYLLSVAAVDVTCQDVNGSTALHILASVGLTTTDCVDGFDHDNEDKDKLAELIQAFITKGADINAIDKQGRTAIDIAKTSIGSVKSESDLIRVLCAIAGNVP